MAQQLFNVRCAYNLHISRYLAACCIIICSMRIVNSQNSDKNRPHFLQQQPQLSAWSVVNAQWTDHQEFTKRQHCYLIGTVVYKFQFSCCISFFSTKSISFNYSNYHKDLSTYMRSRMQIYNIFLPHMFGYVNIVHISILMNSYHDNQFDDFKIQILFYF